jgi:sugar/nucleoside kinase (ribokinase family)
MDPYAGEVGRRACAVAAREGLIIVAMDCTGSPEVNVAASVSVTSSEQVGPDKPLEDLATFAAAVRDRYGPTTIVTLGEHGCLIARGGAASETVGIAAYVPPEIVDTTGAGDVFRAGLLYGHLQGWDLEKTARFASAAAALNCGALGGWGGVRAPEEIAAFQRTAALRAPPLAGPVL